MKILGATRLEEDFRLCLREFFTNQRKLREDKNDLQCLLSVSLFRVFFSYKDLLSLNGELLPEPDVLFIEVADLLHGEDRKQAGEQDQDDAAGDDHGDHDGDGEDDVDHGDVDGGEDGILEDPEGKASNGENSMRKIYLLFVVFLWWTRWALVGSNGTSPWTPVPLSKSVYLYLCICVFAVELSPDLPSPHQSLSPPLAFPALEIGSAPSSSSSSSAQTL